MSKFEYRIKLREIGALQEKLHMDFDKLAKLCNFQNYSEDEGTRCHHKENTRGDMHTKCRMVNCPYVKEGNNHVW